MRYTDEKGRTIYAGVGLGGDKFMALYTKNGISNHRLKSPALPIRDTLKEAEADLAAYARTHSFEVSNDNELEILTHEIIIYKNKTAQNFIEIGKRLKLAKAKLKHGEWLDWLRDKVEFSRGMAARLIQCADEFSNVPPAEHLPLSKMFELLSLSADKRDNFLKNNDVKSMSKRQLRQAVKAEKNADKITTTATIEIVPNMPTSAHLSSNDDMDIPTDLPVIDNTYSIPLIEKIKEGYVSLSTAAEIAHKFPSDSKNQEQAMLDANVKHQQDIVELDEEYMVRYAFIWWHIYEFKRDGIKYEANIYTAEFMNKHYLIKITCWKPAADSESSYPCNLIFYKKFSWERAYENDEDAECQGMKIVKNRFNCSLKERGVSNFTLEITPEIASQINKSNVESEPDQSPSEIECARTVLLTSLKSAKKQCILNGSENNKVSAAFYVLLIEYLQNIDPVKIKSIMEES